MLESVLLTPGVLANGFDPAAEVCKHDHKL